MSNGVVVIEGCRQGEGWGVVEESARRKEKGSGGRGERGGEAI